MLNQCNFIGRLGKDPETRMTQSGTKVANFSLAVSEKYKDKSGAKQEKTEWVNVVCWNEGLISVIENYLSKGSQVYISGKMQTRKWTDQSGNDKYTTEIVMQGFDSKLVMLGGNDARPSSPQEESPQDDGFESDDIPW